MSRRPTWHPCTSVVAPFVKEVEDTVEVLPHAGCLVPGTAYPGSHLAGRGKGQIEETSPVSNDTGRRFACMQL
jgi:hypothetical protein